MGIALQLWNCCAKDLQTILRSNVIVNKCMEPKMLTKMKAVAVRTQKVLVNINNFPCMKQPKAKSLRRELGRLRDASRH